jgi:hypothetical protein
MAVWCTDRVIRAGQCHGINHEPSKTGALNSSNGSSIISFYLIDLIE